MQNKKPGRKKRVIQYVCIQKDMMTDIAEEEFLNKMSKKGYTLFDKTNSRYIFVD